MLKYFKKGRRRGSSEHSVDVVDDACGIQKRNSLRSSSSFCDEIFWEEEIEGVDDGKASLGAAYNEDAIFDYSSRLSMCLRNILGEPNCLSYFVQFLENKNALPLIRFYLDTENFRKAALSQLQKEHQHDMLESKSQLTQQAVCDEDKTGELVETQMTKADEENESENNVPELKTLYDLSMRKPLTDDEKSQIYAETNKQLESNKKWLTKGKYSSQLSLSSMASTNAGNDLDYALVSAASVKDALIIYQKYLGCEAVMPLKLPVQIISQISLLLCQRKSEDESQEVVTANCFEEAQQHVLQQLEAEYLLDFSQSANYSKYCLELMDEGKLCIFDVLYSETALFYFMEFLEQKGERNCLDFWTAALNYRKSCENSAEAQADAMILYDRFFSLQSEGRLWLSDKLRWHVEKKICSEQPDLQLMGCFDLPLQVMAKYLEKKYLHQFLKSQLFENYRSELLSKLQENESGCNQLQPTSLTMPSKLILKRSNSLKTNPHSRHRKTRSDCSSDSINNTLLAMQSSLVKLPTASEQQNCNSPLLLSHRYSMFENSSSSLHGGLKFGYVNSMGRYERDFDTCDNYANNNLLLANSQTKSHSSWSSSLSSGGSKFKNVMRRLINMPEEKVQEEIAWQVAEMIVKDVTSITLSKPTNKPEV